MWPYCVLQDHGIDLFHLLLLGLGKHFLQTLTKHGYLTKPSFAEIQRRCDSLKLPAEIGATPRKIGALFVLLY